MAIGPRQRLAARIALAVVGAYACAALAVAVLPLGLMVLGSARSDAVVIAAMLGYVVYLVLALWVAATPRLARAAVVIGTGMLGWLAVALGLPG